MNQNLEQLKNKINQISLQLARDKGVKERIESQLDDLRNTLKLNTQIIKNKKDAHLLILGFIAQRREAAIESFESTGTYALRAVYGDDRSLVFLKNEEKKNSAAFKMEIGIESSLGKTRVVTGLKDERGGGCSEVSAFSLRFRSLEALGYKGPLLLDEAFKSMSSDDKIVNVAQLLKKYVEFSNRQIIFATHKADVFKDYADHIIHITQRNGVSHAS